MDTETNTLANKIGVPATLELMAEESVELAHACLKYARYLRDENRYGRMYDGMTRQKAIYIQARMLEWIPAQVTACLLLGLHRKQGFGSERLAKLYGDFQDVLSRYPMKGRMHALKRDCISLTGIRVERKSNGTLVDEE